MSLWNPPSDSVAAHTMCTCATPVGVDGIPRHTAYCAKIDESHPARDRAREAIAENWRRWGSP